MCKNIYVMKHIRQLTTKSLCDAKQVIINLFNNNVKGMSINTVNGVNSVNSVNKIQPSIKHCGKEGHWLEKAMGIKHNSNNLPDIYGYEMKSFSSKVISLGDFSASEYAFSAKRDYINNINNWNYTKHVMIRSDFIRYFGTPNPLKNNRYSWSGKCVPIYNSWNVYGQILTVNENNDIVIRYSHTKDTRSHKETFPDYLKENEIVIAWWKEEKLRNHINNKFDVNGFFLCKKVNNVYDKICFGKKFDYQHFIGCVKTGKIKFDSGMYIGNNRNYSHFRGSVFWDELIEDEY